MSIARATYHNHKPQHTMNNFNKSFKQQTIESEGLTKQEETIYKNFKAGLAIFLFLALLGLVLEITIV